ncbi:MAG TPA: KpsF/GutQ family sugar-phosphate isomerase [Cryomorphaceae bacterium]|nr:KpsF/GutQ family sugar-phosphate isomerase [Cryomorphaceae bacterium]
MSINKRTIASIEAQAKSILDLAQHDTNDYESAVKMITACRGKLIFTGMGKSGIIARKLAATFSSTGVPSFFVHPGEAYHGDLGMIEAADVLFAFSNSGETTELINLLKYSRSKSVIGMSNNHNSTLASFATVHLECTVDKEICPLNLAPTTSSTAALVIGDAICATIMEMSNFSEEDFAALHPGGSLGKSLLTKAKNLMITEVPFVNPTDSLHEVLLRISEGRLGLACIGSKNDVLGVITDGDIRRAIEHTENSKSLVAEQMGSKNPIFIEPETGLHQMNLLFRQKKIVSVLVGSSNDLKGVVQFYDIHDG